MKIIGQQLINCGESFGFGDGLGCGLSAGGLELAMWSGLGPHSTGSCVEPKRVRDKDCLVCGARWFLPFLDRLKSGDNITLDELEQAHLRSFGRPMIEMKGEGEIVQQFNSHVKAGGCPEQFFTACRIVKWEKDKQFWLEIFST